DPQPGCQPGEDGAGAAAQFQQRARARKVAPDVPADAFDDRATVAHHLVVETGELRIRRHVAIMPDGWRQPLPGAVTKSLGSPSARRARLGYPRGDGHPGRRDGPPPG